MTMTVEYANIIFSTIFAIEMILKIVGEGPRKYVKDVVNLFDACIVIIR